MNGSTRWLTCKVRTGMFSDEAVVEVTTADGREKSFFVPGEQVEGGNRVRVEVARRDGVPWVTLPTAHPFMPIPVREEDLSEESVVA